MKFQPKDSNFKEKVFESFSQQSVMNLIGAEITRILPGIVHIQLPFRDDLTQQNGFLHAGITTTIADSSCGYASFSLMPEDTSPLSVEFKINLLSPAIGEYFRAEGRVIRPGNTLTVAQSDVFAFKGKEKKQIATMISTVICLKNTRV